jgi:hypothetical protein
MEVPRDHSSMPDASRGIGKFSAIVEKKPGL